MESRPSGKMLTDGRPQGQTTSAEGPRRAMRITIPKPEERKRSIEDDYEKERKDPTNLRGKRPISTTRRKKKKSIGGGASKSTSGPLVDKDDNPLLVSMMEEEEEEQLRETLHRSLVEKYTPYIPFFENQQVSLHQRLIKEAVKLKTELEATRAACVGTSA